MGVAAAKDAQITADKTTTTYNVRVPAGASDEQMDKIVQKLREKLGPESCGGGPHPAGAPGVPGVPGAPPAPGAPVLPGGLPTPPPGDAGAKAAAAEIAAT